MDCRRGWFVRVGQFGALSLWSGCASEQTIALAGIVMLALVLIALQVRPRMPAPQGAKPQTSIPRPLPAGRPPFVNGPFEGVLFEYPKSVAGSTVPSSELFAIIDLETTGLSPHKDRIVEVAIARVDASGRVLAEFTTLVNPEMADTGPSWIHRIEPEAVKSAPTFREIAPDVVAFLSGAVVVAHNLPFEEWFLAAELRRAGVPIPRLRGLDTCWMSRGHFRDLPNHRLGTVASACGVGLENAHAAAADVAALRGVLGYFLAASPGLAWRKPFETTIDAPTVKARTRPRAPELSRAEGGWMGSLLRGLPEVGSADGLTTEYAELVAAAMSDGKVAAQEARKLAEAATDAGLGVAQVRAVHADFLEGLRDVALSDEVLTAAELKQLRSAAKNLGLPDYFDDLSPTATEKRKEGPKASDSGTARARPQAPVRGAGKTKCGNCGQTGHNRRTCTSAPTLG